MNTATLALYDALKRIGVSGPDADGMVLSRSTAAARQHAERRPLS
jgi:hypothetical protein